MLRNTLTASHSSSAYDLSRATRNGRGAPLDTSRTTPLIRSGLNRQPRSPYFPGPVPATAHPKDFV